MESFVEKAIVSVKQFWDDLGTRSGDILFAIIKIALIILAAYIVIVVLKRLSRRILKARAARKPVRRQPARPRPCARWWNPSSNTPSIFSPS